MLKNEIQQNVFDKATLTKSASRILSTLTTQEKNKILSAMADALEKNINEILFHNNIDVDVAKQANVTPAILDRLTLNEQRIRAMAQGVRDVVKLNDPVGTLVKEYKPTAKIDVKKIRVPLGVVAMIYEARPNVTVDAATLCLKSGNAVILKGGSEAINSNKILVKIICEAGQNAGMPKGAIQFFDTSDRTAVLELLKLDSLVDLIIPRGSEELVKFIKSHSLIPVLSHGKGLCHTYVDKDANIDMAVKIAINAKSQRPGVCNAMETLLVHKDIAKTFLPKICDEYFKRNVKILGCEISKSIVPKIEIADETQWDKEYLDLIISIKVVNDLDEAIEHINQHGSMHSEAIITDNKQSANKFLMSVDSAAVFVNASTRLHDGSVFGLGCEIGISTQKLHARGAMGLEELTTTKYIVCGNGTIRQ